MKLIRRLFHPLFTFIGLQIIWILVLVFWIYWFLGRHRQLRDLAERYQAEWLPGTSDWLILTEGILLLVAILAGIYVIFLYWRRQNALVRAQSHFINQVTHELKSPLASLQLHLETIEMRRLEGAQLQHFIALMKSDSQRLDSLISNLLTAGRVEHKGARLNLETGDLSHLVERYLLAAKDSFPPDGQLSWQVDPGLRARFETEAVETILRNLLENAVLYSDDAPQVEIRLRRDGQSAHLTISDRGRGIPRTYQRKVFRMFYRLRQSGKNVRGSGLGLFIVRNIMRLHRGKIWVESPGEQHATTFHLTFPLAEPYDRRP